MEKVPEPSKKSTTATKFQNEAENPLGGISMPPPSFQLMASSPDTPPVQREPDNSEKEEKKGSEKRIYRGLEPLKNKISSCHITYDSKSGLAIVKITNSDDSLSKSFKVKFPAINASHDFLGSGSYTFSTDQAYDEGEFIPKGLTTAHFNLKDPVTTSGPSGSSYKVSLESMADKNLFFGACQFLNSHPVAAKVLVLGKDQKEKEKSKKLAKPGTYDFDLPKWFSEVKKGVNQIHDKNLLDTQSTSNLPKKLSYYGFQLSPLTVKEWKIQVIDQSGHLTWLDIKETRYEAASDKTALYQEIYAELLQKVFSLGQTTRLAKAKRELKTGDPRGKLPAWLKSLRTQLMQELKTLDVHERKKAEAKFEGHVSKVPDKLDFDFQQGHYFLKVKVKEEESDEADKENSKPKGTVYRSGLILIPLDKKMLFKHKSLISPIQEMVKKLRQKHIYTPVPKKDTNKQVLPAYPAHIKPLNVNPDGTVQSGGKNGFRMMIDLTTAHGAGRVALTTAAHSNRMYFWWVVYKVTDEVQAEADQLSGWAAQRTYLQKNSHRMHMHISPSFEDASDMARMNPEEELAMPKKDGAYVVQCFATPEVNDKYIQGPSEASMIIRVKKTNSIGYDAVMDSSNRLFEKQIELLTTEGSEQLNKETAELEAIESKENNYAEITDQKISDLKKLDKTAKRLQTWLRLNRKQASSQKAQLTITALMNSKDPEILSLWTTLLRLYPQYEPEYSLYGFVEKIEQQLKALAKLRRRIGTADIALKNYAEVQKPIVRLERKDSGQIIPILMLLGQESKPDAKGNGEFKYKLIDVTRPTLKASDRTFVGSGKTKSEAIKNAFTSFGEEKHYGEGQIHYRLPGTSAADSVPSKMGLKQKLEIAGTFMGAAALVAGAAATGGILAPATAAYIGAAAATLGVTGAVLGGGLALDNILERSDKGTLEPDADLAMDVFDIVASLVALGALAKGAKATKGLRIMKHTGKLIEIFETGETAGMLILTSAQLHADLLAVEELDLDPKEKRALQMQLGLAAAQSGAMAAFSASKMVSDAIALKKAKVEGAKYPSLHEMGWVDADGKWTSLAPERYRNAAKKKAVEPTDIHPPMVDGPEGKLEAKSKTNPAEKKNTTTDPIPHSKKKSEGNNDSRHPKNNAENAPGPKKNNQGPENKPEPASKKVKSKAEMQEEVLSLSKHIDESAATILEEEKRIQLGERVWKKRKEALVKEMDLLKGKNNKWKNDTKKETPWGEQYRALRKRIKSTEAKRKEYAQRRSLNAAEKRKLAAFRKEKKSKWAKLKKTWPGKEKAWKKHEAATDTFLANHLGIAKKSEQVFLEVTIKLDADDQKKQGGKSKMTLTFKPDNLTKEGGRYFIYDSKYSAKESLSSKNSSILNTCTPNQKLAYKYIASGQITHARVLNAGTGSLPLRPNTKIKLGLEIGFITNSDKAGKVDYLSYKNGRIVRKELDVDID